MSQVHIVAATTADIPQILEIVNYYIVNDTCIYDIEPRSLEKQIDWFNQLTVLGYPVIVAKIDHMIIGFASYSQFRPKVGYKFSMEHSVYVSHREKGKGIGKLLLQTLIDIAQNQGVHLLIGGIDANNTDSIAFHENFGFEIVGKMSEVGFKFDKWHDLVWMQKKINT
jgi:phosphinothricin acetyltransferase